MSNLTPTEQDNNGKLTEKQIRFCEEYLIDLNGKQAAIRAGYSKKSAPEIACENLMKPNVKKFIMKLKKRISAKAILTAQETLEEASIVARSSIENYIDIDELTGVIRAKGFKEMPKDSIRALQSVEENRAIKESSDGEDVVVYDKVKFKTHPKMRAIEFLGKYHGLGEDKGQRQPEAIIDNRNLNFTVVHINGKGENVEESLKELKKMSDAVIKGEVVDKGNNK
jgi:phage terminase small subunit